jgi:hypothetical protein
MSIDTCLGQPQPLTQIDGKFADLRTTGPSSHERGLSGPTTTGPNFRNELPRPAPEPPYTVQTLNDPFGLSACSAGQSEYNIGWSDYIAARSAYLTGRSGAEYVEPYEEDYYPHPSQLNFPSHHAAPQHHNITSQTHGGEYFSAPPRRPKRNEQSYETHRASINAPKTQTDREEDNILISKQLHPCWTRELVVSHRLSLI